MRNISIFIEVAAAGLLIFGNATAANAETSHQSAPTHVTKKILVSADGTVTLEGRYASPNPHCLEAKRWKKLSDGYYHYGFNAYPVFGGESGTAPNDGWLAPVSPFERSPLIWKAVWPGQTISRVGPPADFVEVPIAEADKVEFFSFIPTSGRPGLPQSAYYTTYKEHGHIIKLACGIKSGDHKKDYPLG